jgi:hypothetical protein
VDSSSDLFACHVASDVIEEDEDSCSQRSSGGQRRSFATPRL